jgi:guanylate kinase
MRGSVLIISGPSGVGKSKISQAIAERLGATLSVSVTTRPIAEIETKDVDYKFIDQAKFDDMRRNGEFLEWADIFGFAYGTLRRPVEEALVDGNLVILEIDVNGATQVMRLMPESRAIFVLPPSETALSDRLRLRGRDNEGDIMTRLSKARREIARAKSSGVYDYFVVNDDLEQAISEITDWIRREMVMTST